MITARLVAGLLFLAFLLLLVRTHRRLGERVRAEEDEAVLRAAFDELRHPAAPPADRAQRSE